MIEIPTKRHTRPLLCYLDLDEIKALLAAPDRTSWLGRRDHALLLDSDPDRAARLRAHQPARCGTSASATGAHCRVIGKGRKAAIRNA